MIESEYFTGENSDFEDDVIEADFEDMFEDEEESEEKKKKKVDKEPGEFGVYFGDEDEDTDEYE